MVKKTRQIDAPAHKTFVLTADVTSMLYFLSLEFDADAKFHHILIMHANEITCTVMIKFIKIK